MNPIADLSLLEGLESLDWKSGLDVFIIGLSIFLLYRTFRTSGTWKIVLGIAVASLTFLLARLLELHAIMWVYSNLSDILLIAAVILFQPELRRIFERAVSLKRLRFSSENRIEGLADMIADTVFRMAKKKIGAILVFPGNESVSAFCSGGVRADAEVSASLLLSIFDTGSPGHDGAVLIENGRLLNFGLRLPVSTSHRLGEHFGTRHHASLGLSEQTDALVVTVSEEKGEVSIFQEGARRRVETMPALIEEILSHWKNLNASLAFPKKGRGLLIPLEFSLSLVAAFALTLFITAGELRLQEMVINIPVEYTGKPAGLNLDGASPSKIRVMLTGTRASLTTMNTDSMRLRIDLSTMDMGDNYYTVAPGQLHLPPGIHATEIDPSSFTLTLHPRRESFVEIQPVLKGESFQDALAEKKIRISVTPGRIPVYSVSSRRSEEELFTGILVASEPLPVDWKGESLTLTLSYEPPEDLRPLGKVWPEVQITLDPIE